MRNRLSELIQSAVGGCAKYWADVIADHLLAEGVIVPPCKVGDTVYCIWQYSDFAKEEAPFIKEEKVFSFILDEGETKVIPEGYGDMTDRWYRLLSVHFTREEAERAVERSENNE